MPAKIKRQEKCAQLLVDIDELYGWHSGILYDF